MNKVQQLVISQISKLLQFRKEPVDKYEFKYIDNKNLSVLYKGVNILELNLDKFTEKDIMGQSVEWKKFKTNNLNEIQEKSHKYEEGLIETDDIDIETYNNDETDDDTCDTSSESNSESNSESSSESSSDVSTSNSSSDESTSSSEETENRRKLKIPEGCTIKRVHKHEIKNTILAELEADTLEYNDKKNVVYLIDE